MEKPPGDTNTSTFKKTDSKNEDFENACISFIRAWENSKCYPKLLPRLKRSQFSYSMGI